MKEAIIAPPAASPEWVVEFEINRHDGSSANAFATYDIRAGVIPPIDGWALLAEGTYKESRGHLRAGKMQPRPLEPCVKRAHKMVQKNPHVPVRLRNIRTGEVIPGDIFA